MQLRFCACFGVMVTCSVTLTALAVDASVSPLNGWEIVDLSHVLDENAPVYPGAPAFKRTKLLDLKDGFYVNSFNMSEHCGTHIDAPSHKALTGKHVSELQPTRLQGPVVVVDVRKHVAANPDYGVSMRTLREFEAVHGLIPMGCFVLAHTGWSSRWKNPKEYVNIGNDGLPHFPGFTADATQYLVNERGVLGMGIDTLSTDVGCSRDFPQHQILLQSGGINIENLTNLDKLPYTGAYLIAAPLPLSLGSGAPARVFAFIPASKARR